MDQRGDFLVIFVHHEHVLRISRTDALTGLLNRGAFLEGLTRFIDRQHRNPPESMRQVFPPPTIELNADRQKCEISHLSLWRDVYYTPTYDGYGSEREISNASPRRPASRMSLAS